MRQQKPRTSQKARKGFEVPKHKQYHAYTFCTHSHMRDAKHLENLRKTTKKHENHLFYNVFVVFLQVFRDRSWEFLALFHRAFSIPSFVHCSHVFSTPTSVAAPKQKSGPFFLVITCSHFGQRFRPRWGWGRLSGWIGGGGTAQNFIK